MHNFTKALKISTLAIVLSFGLSYVYAWTAPNATPPGGNVSAPINTSATAQTKAGELTVSGLTTTSALNMGTNNIVAGGANSTYGAMTIQGAKNTYSGLNFKNSSGANSGTLMMHPSYSGFFGATDNKWRMLVTEPTGTASYGNVYAQDYYIGATGKWASQGATGFVKSCPYVINGTTYDGVIMYHAGTAERRCCGYNSQYNESQFTVQCYVY